MSNAPLTHAATEFIRQGFDRVNSREAPETSAGSTISDDFALADRRSGGVNFGVLDRSAYRSLLGCP